jgi:hypothetical protein
MLKLLLIVPLFFSVSVNMWSVDIFCGWTLKDIQQFWNSAYEKYSKGAFVHTMNACGKVEVSGQLITSHFTLGARAPSSHWVEGWMGLRA